MFVILGLAACSTNYKVASWVDGQAGVQALRGPQGSETPITSPYVIQGKADVIAQYPGKPHLEVILDPTSTIDFQTNQRYGAGQCAPYGTVPSTGLQMPRGKALVLDQGSTLIRRK